MYRKLFVIGLAFLMIFSVMPRTADAQEQILGPWLWMIVQLGEGGGAAATDIDSLADASDNAVTEAMVAQNGAKEGDTVGDYKWTLAELPANGDINTVVNESGMEEGASRWVLPRPQYARDAAVVRTSQESIRWQSDGGEPVVPAIRRVLKDDGKLLAATAGRRYALEAWVRTADVRGGMTVSLEWNGDMGFIGRAQSRPVDGTRDWTRVAVETPALPSYVYCCRVVLSALPGTTGTAWFDSIMVAEVE